MEVPETIEWLTGVMPDDLEYRTIEGMVVGAGTLIDGRALATTANFATVDTGLTMQDQPSVAVRCELFVCARVPVGIAVAFLLATAATIADADGAIPAQPQTVVPGVGHRAGLSAANGFTVAHGFLRVPTLWGPTDTPQVREENRLTLPLGVTGLTEDEYEVYSTGGLDRMLTRLRRRNTDFSDWRR